MIIRINKSYALGVLGYFLALLAVLALMLSPIPVMLKILVSVAVMAATYRQVRRVALLKTTRSIVALGIGNDRENGGMELYLGEDSRTPVPYRVVRSHVSKNLVTAQLNASTGNQRCDLFLIRPMCGREEFRVLKRFLLSLKEPLTE